MKKRGFLYQIGRISAQARAKMLEGFYSVHVKLRYLHDKTYQTGPKWYKTWSDKSYSNNIHKATLLAFIASFIVFYSMQYLLPALINPLSPNKAMAESNTVTWDSQAELNGSSAPANSGFASATLTQAPVSSADFTLNPGYIRLAATAPTDLTTGTDFSGCSVNIATGVTVNIVNLYNDATVTGVTIDSCTNSSYNGTNKGFGQSSVATYNPATNKIPIVNNLTINGTGTLTTNTLVKLVIKVKGTLSGSGSINVDAKGYAPNAGPVSGAQGEVGCDIWCEIGASGGSGGGGYNAVGGAGQTLVSGDVPNGLAGGAGGGINTAFPDFGSGGGSGNNTDGFGGGIIDLQVNNFGLTGTVTAKGQSSALYSGAGGGAGGAILLSSNLGSIDGTKISVQGGSGDTYSGSLAGQNGAGAGGRLKIKGNVNGTPNYLGGSAGVPAGTPDAEAYVNLKPFQTTSAISGYKVDAGAGKKVSWNSLSWSATTPTNTSVKFNVRTSDDNATWSGWSNDLTTAAGSTITASTSRHLEIKTTLISDGNDTPVLNSFSVVSKNLDAPTTLKAYKSDTTDISATSNYTNETSATLKADLGMPYAPPTAPANPNGTITPEFEVRTADSGWTSSPAAPVGITVTKSNTTYSCATDPCSALGTKTVGTISGMSAGTTYYWRVRSTDTAGRVSAWSATSTVINVDQTAPTITSVTINSDAVYTGSNLATIALTGAVDTGGSGLGQMRFSNNGSNWSTWETYSATKTNWNLTDSNYGGNSDQGTKTVYVSLKDNAGNEINTLSGTTVAASNGYMESYWGDCMANYSSMSLYIDPDDQYYSYLKFDNSSLANSSKVLLSLNFSGTVADFGIDSVGSYTDFCNPALNSVTAFSNISPLSATGGINAYDVTSLVRADITAGRNYSAFRLTPYNSPYVQISNLSDPNTSLRPALKAYSNFVTDSISYDNTAPTGTISLKDPVTGSTSYVGAAANKAVTVIMNPTETGSGMASFQLSNDGITWGTTTDTSGVVSNSGAWGIWNDAYKTTGYAGNWYLSGADNTKTVYVKYKDNAGNIGGDYDDSWIKIGTQTWAKTNLNVGTKIDPYSVTASDNGIVEKVCYGGNQTNCNTYGGLYSWNELMGYSSTEGSQGICPTNSHIPTDAEWATLENYVTFDSLKLKIGGETGFEAPFAGTYTPAARYVNLNNIAYYATSTSVDGANAWERYWGASALYTSGGTRIQRGSVSKGNSISARCIRNSDVPAPILNSITLDATAPTVSSAPTISTNPNNTGNQTVSWSGFNDTNPSSGFDKYIIQRKISGGEYQDIQTERDSAVTSFADNANLAEGTYYYRVVAYDKAGNSNASSDSTALVVDKTNPNTSAAPTVTPNPNSTGNQTISWSLFGDGGTSSGFQKYVVQRSGDGVTWDDIHTENTVGTTSYVDNAGLAEGTYQYRVATYDLAGNFSTSNVTQLAVDKTPPTDVTISGVYEDSGKAHNITANNTTKWYPYSPYFEFSATDGEGSGIQTYKYCFATDQNCTPSTPTLGNAAYLSLDLSSYTDGTYYFRVIAVDNAGQPSNNVTTFQYNFDKTAPTAVTGLAAATSATYPEVQINLSWNTFPTTGRAPIENYRIERIKYLSYQNNHFDMTNSDWSGGDGYGLFTTTATTFVDSTDPTAGDYPDASYLSTRLQGQAPLEASTRYIYRISAKDTSNLSYGPWQSNPITALTKDIAAPTPVPNVTNVQACTVSANLCSDTDSVNGGANTPGFSVKVSFTSSDDIGSGMAGYRIYRASNDSATLSDWTLVGFLPYQSGQNTVWYDNDTNNDAAYSGQKTLQSPRLNDKTTYYYRVTAVDAATAPANETPLIPDDINNVAGHAITPDVTAPTIPTGVAVNPQGLDSSNDHQMMNVSWDPVNDYKARSTEIASETVTYHIYRATSSLGPWTNLVGTTTSTNLDDEGLASTTTYYYRVTAFDTVPNESALSTLTDSSSATTFSGEVPSVPTSVMVTSKKGDPNTDSEVGHQITVSWSGSMSNAYDVVQYEVYRAKTNTTGSCNNGENPSTCWIRVNNATKINTTEITPTPDDRGNTHTITDTNLDNSTAYYYRVRSQDNTTIPNHPEQSDLYSGFTAITSALNTGWDITPDDEAPQIPKNGLEVKVRDTHPNDIELRNIVTWLMLSGSDVPTRNGNNDFARYEVWREVYNPESDALLETSKVAEKTTINENFFTDTIDLNGMTGALYTKDCKIRYYIVVVDNAGTDFKYSNGTVINGTSNVSAKEYAPDSIIPAKAKPSLVGTVGVSDVQVATATVSWTTDQEADSIVQFRPQGSTGEWTIDGQVERSINHTVQLKGLSPNTAYEYQIVSRNYLGNNIENIGTLPQIKTTGFNITTGEVVTTTSTTEINWSTNLNASSAFVEYTLQRQPGDDAQGGTAGVEPNILSSSPKNHKVIIKGLRSNRTYTYKIKSISTDGFVTETGFLTFKTKSFDSEQFTLAPSSSNVAERNITSTTAQIVWQTGSPTTSWVDYGTKTGVYDISAGDNNLTSSHVVVLTGLVPGTKYYYRVRVKDSNEVEFTSQEYTFTAVLKPKIEGLTISNVTPYSVTISWNTNVDTETLMNWGTSTAYGVKQGNAVIGKIHSVTIDNLQDNTEYHYQILAHDQAGNEVADDDRNVRTPLDTNGPKISDVKNDILLNEADNTAQVIISWKTDKPATTLVQYDEGVLGGRYSKATVEDTGLSNTHTVIIKDLDPGITYHYRIVTRDKRSNETISNDYNFITPTAEKSVLQLILKSLEETFSWIGNLGKFFSGLSKKTE